MPYYRVTGDVPPKRHTQHRGPDGRLPYEESTGEEGASSGSSPLHHRHIPSVIVADEGWRERDTVTGRRPFLGNAQVRLAYAVAGRPSPPHRDAEGDQCVHVEPGEGVVDTVFGVLPFHEGDHVVIPRATTHRWVPLGRVRSFIAESSSHIAPARRCLSRHGQLLEPAHGWDGCPYPYTFDIADFEPITGRAHQPPPVHQVFEGDGWVICDFVPRMVGCHPRAVPVPYHSDVDSDEVMFCCGGDYEPRKGSGVGQGSAFSPLLLGEAAAACEADGYAWTSAARQEAVR